MTRLSILIVVLLAGPASAQTQQRFYDARGNSVGTAVQTSPSSQRFHDASGRSTGTATTDSRGTTTFYDARGNVIGRGGRK